jgi:flagellar biogenesis protein FliO
MLGQGKAARRGDTAMTSSGIILAIVIALIVAYAVARTRRRMGLMVSGKTWLAVIAGVVVVLLALWATQTH